MEVNCFFIGSKQDDAIINKEKNSNILRKIFILIVILPLMAFESVCFAANFAVNASYDLCFTPGEDCSNKIIRAIAQAKQEILVQAYSFSDISIARSLALAKSRGIDVKAILDKSQLKAKYSLIPYLISNNIYPVIDYEPAIAHNKIIILDRHIVVGGSYNFSHAANHKNAENVVIIDDPKFAEKYVKYWHVRRNRSKEIYNFKTNKANNYVRNNPDPAR